MSPLWPEVYLRKDADMKDGDKVEKQIVKGLEDLADTLESGGDVKASTTVINGQLQICHERGVIYFHDKNQCVLRICSLPTPIPQLKKEGGLFQRTLDITHLYGCDWGKAEWKSGKAFGEGH